MNIIRSRKVMFDSRIGCYERDHGIFVEHVPTRTLIANLEDGMVINVDSLDYSPHYSVQADVVGDAVGLVKFLDNGRRDNQLPSSRCGDAGPMANTCACPTSRALHYLSSTLF